MSNIDRFIEFLKSYGVRNISLNASGEELKISCPFPGHANNDESPSASINIEKGVFNCLSLHGGMTLKKFLEKLTGKKSVRTESRPNTVKQKEFFKRNRFLMKKKILDISYKAQRKIVDVIRSIFYPYKTSVAYHLNPIVDVIWDEKDYIDKRLTNSLDYLQAFSEYSDWAINAKDLLNSTDIYIKKLGLREVENENT